MSVPDFTRDELLDLLIEEAAEVIHAASKIKRFGWHHRGYKHDDVRNDHALSCEVGELLAIIDALRNDAQLDTVIISEAKHHKLQRALATKLRAQRETQT